MHATGEVITDLARWRWRAAHRALNQRHQDHFAPRAWLRADLRRSEAALVRLAQDAER